MLLIYSKESSPRLQYICKFIFEEILGIAYSLTTHAESFATHDGARINYNEIYKDNTYNIEPHSLLFETAITGQKIECKGAAENIRFFCSSGADHSFDIFAASFYLLSRYEEYLPHNKDYYGRYAHQNSIAHQMDFVKIPLVNFWIADLKKNLQQCFPELLFPEKNFSFFPTYDIDMAWSYKEKGWARNIAGFIKSPAADRLFVLGGSKKDPYDCYDFLDRLHEEHHVSPLYFFLAAKKNGEYDKHILPTNPAMNALINRHVNKYEIGLHPSWQSNEAPHLLTEEKTTLETITGKSVSASRQHYIKFDLPHTYERLVATGITDDYSMGYGSINGFRASVASPFRWFNLLQNEITALCIHPFCFMDANCFYEEGLSAQESFTELKEFYYSCKKINGKLITVFHNNFLGTDKKFSGWKDLYSNFISQVQL